VLISLKKFITLDGNHYELWIPQRSGAAVITYGNLLQATINFVIIALFVFLILERLKNEKKEVIIAAAATPAGPTQEELLIQIRDLLKIRIPLYYMFP
jgi:large conductance mechanosensitive channel